METTGKKTGWLLLCGAALTLCVLLQYLCPQILFWGAWLYEKIKLGAADAALLQNNVYAWYTGHALWAAALYHIVGAAAFGFWYKALRRGGAFVPVKQTFRLQTVCAVLLTGVGLQFLLSCVLQMIYLAAPQLLQGYNQMMENTGIGDVSALSLAVTVIAAPLSEELLCRGVILHCAQKAAGRFWAANLIQAAAFGLIHMNWVQGLYAFVLGLVLGAFCHWHGSVFSSIALHAVINLSGLLLVDAVLGAVPAKVMWYLPLSLLFAAVCGWGLWLAAGARQPDKTNGPR
ncbi:MAG: type II CAAX endopeptidase family protein [Oscillospiraceae bacterium]|nr:type II CAAX endopeptidase family protein [Oscillospiraceae bacterium]